MRKVYPAVGKDRRGWVHFVRLSRLGFTMRNWAGSTLLRWRMEAFGFGIRPMVGDGPKMESSPTSSDGVIRAGSTFKEDTKAEPFFSITQPSHLNKID